MTETSTFALRLIRRAILNAMQEADEIGGPDSGDYVALMRGIAVECNKRADTCERNARKDKTAECLAWVKENVDEGAEIWETGSGCTAIRIPLPQGVGHWLITDDASAPEKIDAPCVLGLYTDSGSSWVLFDCLSLRAAGSIIKSLLQFEG